MTHRGWILGLLAACAGEPPCGEQAPTTISPVPGGGGNVLVVVLDDVGAEQLASYGFDNPVARTPTIDCLCERGLQFGRAWGAPRCSPGRAALMTGRQSDRTGVGYNVRGDGASRLPDEEQTLAELVAGAGYTSGLAGKWHLDAQDGPHGLDAPQAQGFDFFAGTLGNIGDNEPKPKGDVEAGYDRWWHIAGGEEDWTHRYATRVDVDDAIDFLRDAEPPWLLVVSLHAPHAPIHDPPAGLLNTPLDRDATTGARYRAGLEAADTELSRLLRWIEPGQLADTTIALVADNGTSEQGTVGPDGALVKGSLYERGIHVPMIVTGPYVAAPGTTSDALVHLVDVFPTVAGIAGVTPEAELDGVDLGPVLAGEGPGPEWAETSWNDQGDALERAVRDDRYKAILRENGVVELYDLVADPLETTNLAGSARHAAAREALLARTGR